MGASIAALVAGCGGQTSTTGAQNSSTTAATTAPPVQRARPPHYSVYETAMQVLGNRLALALEDSGLTVNSPGSTTGEVVAALRRAQHQLRVSAVALAKIKPPRKIRALHDQLLKGVRDFAAELDGVIASAERGADSLHIAATIPTLKGLREMQRASDAITKAGYVIVVHAQSG
jgi:hypothetical protein